MKLVISDAHRGLVAAVGSALPGAAWQRCRTHYLRNLLTKVPKSAQPWVATMVRTIFDQPDAGEVRAQFARSWTPSPVSTRPLTLAEVRRLLAHLITGVRSLASIHRWSRWRRRHQHRARISHYQRRLHQR